MVHTNVEYHGYELPVLVQFGNGDVRITTAAGEDHCSIVLNNIPPMEIGTDLRHEIKDHVGNKVTDLKPEALLMFSASKSIDVMIEVLQSIREELVSKGL